MLVKTHTTGLKETTWREYAIRFLFGGLITAAAGFIGEKWGPVMAGLFLAFPAIFPASATLLQKHASERKRKEGLHGEQRGIDVAADDAVGAAIGSVGLVAFALICWFLLPRFSPVLVLIAATIVWFSLAVSIWMFRKRGWRKLRRS